jgi:DNA primase
VVNYDGDNAGIQAAKKAIEILLAEDLEVKILVLPDNSDPDEFIRKSGTGEYQRLRGEAQPHIQFVIDQALRDRRLSNPADKEAAINEVLPYIRAVGSRIQKHEYFDIAMDSLRISDPAMKRELWHSIRMVGAEGARARQVASKPTQIKPTVAEEHLLGVVFSDETRRAGVLRMLQPEDYEDLATAPIFRALLELEREHQEPSFDNLSAKTEGDAQISALLPMLMMSESLHASNAHYTPEECVYTFRLMKLQSRIDELRDQSLIAEREGDSERLAQLSAEQTELARRKSALFPKAEAMQNW